MKNIVLGIVLPCFNEEEVLKISIPKLINLLNEFIEKNIVSKNSFLCFVDDGSTDNTWKIISKETKKENIKGIKLSRNFGHQSAILAGMMTYKELADCIITIDVDLQDDILVISKMIEDYKKGNQIVYGVRKKRNTDTYFKKRTALLYNHILKKMGVDIIFNHADFRLIGKNALNALSIFEETNLFLRGLFPLLGFKTSIQYYDRKPRLAGETKYSFNKMAKLAWNGITSFSTIPLKIATFIGWIAIIGSISIAIWSIFIKIQGNSIPGWFSTVIPIYFIGGIQLLILGIMGEYIGKIYLETKKRPKYIVEKILQ